MKKCLFPLLFLFTLFIVSCSGSDTYRGKWKATDESGAHLDINFEPKSFSVTDEHGKTVKYEYTQNQIKIENSVRTYGIKLADGRKLNIVFPIANETGKGLITMESLEPVYTISRTAYINYGELTSLNPQ